MYTVESLLDIAKEAESKYQELLKQFPAGIVNDDRYYARRIMKDALTCALYIWRVGV